MAFQVPPKPIEVVIARPPVAQPEPDRDRNPRAMTPNEDPRLHRATAPAQSTAEHMAGVADGLRQLAVDQGLRFYEVFSVIVRWSGGERGRGTPTLVRRTPFLPVPKVTGLDGVSKMSRPGGTVERGEVRVTGISARYTEDDIEYLLPRALCAGEESWVEIVADKRDGNAPIRRFAVVGVPVRKTLGWEVRLTKADEDRTRGGKVP